MDVSGQYVPPLLDYYRAKSLPDEEQAMPMEPVRQDPRDNAPKTGPVTRSRTTPAIPDVGPSMAAPHGTLSTLSNRASTKHYRDMSPVYKSMRLSSLREFRTIDSSRGDRLGGGSADNWSQHLAKVLVAYGYYELLEREMGAFQAIELTEEALQFYMELCPSDSARKKWQNLRQSFDGRYESVTRQEEASAKFIRLSFGTNCQDHTEDWHH